MQNSMSKNMCNYSPLYHICQISHIIISVPCHYLVCYDIEMATVVTIAAVVPCHCLVCYDEELTREEMIFAVVPCHYLVCYDDLTPGC